MWGFFLLKKDSKWIDYQNSCWFALCWLINQLLTVSALHLREISKQTLEPAVKTSEHIKKRDFSLSGWKCEQRCFWKSLKLFLPEADLILPLTWSALSPGLPDRPGLSSLFSDEPENITSTQSGVKSRDRPGRNPNRNWNAPLGQIPL